MNEQQRDELRERNRRRGNCPRCGSPNTHDHDGATLSSDSHFAGVIYKICAACGHEAVKRIRRGK